MMLCTFWIDAADVIHMGP